MEAHPATTCSGAFTQEEGWSTDGSINAPSFDILTHAGGRDASPCPSLALEASGEAGMHTIRISGEELDRVITVAIAQGVDCVKGWAYFVHVDHNGSITIGGPH